MQKAIIFHENSTHRKINRQKTEKILEAKKEKEKAMKKNDVKRMQKKSVCVCVSAVWKVIKSKEDPKKKSEKKIPISENRRKNTKINNKKRNHEFFTPKKPLNILHFFYEIHKIK